MHQTFAFSIKGAAKRFHIENGEMSASDSSTNLENQIIEKRFSVGQPIGKGSFGEVYDGYDKITGQRVAIKFEDRNSTHSQLENEYQVRMKTTNIFLCTDSYVKC